MAHKQKSIKSSGPVEKNEEFEIEIEDLTHEGNGVGKLDGYTFFIPGVLPGERVRAKAVKLKKQYGFARLLEIITPSEERVDPICPVFKRCGGCTLQHTTYESQLAFKHRMVEENVRRIGKIEGVPIHPTIGMIKPWRYRNKSQVPFGEEEGGLIGGFYAMRTHEIIDIEECLIQHETSDLIVKKVKEIGKKHGITAYREEDHKGLLRHVVSKVGFATGEVMVVLVTNGKIIPNEWAFIQELSQTIPGIKSIVQN
ncbi:MAG TPA: 23S rRNA (uracil(1939)-C(5))-methyltransferase RlmD, partial [Paenibacillaceae bacterium]|nr:23S rRNA (uracil(1939)-C(5))-methyltransferase RlmD [Paenibacillaceae bacterium]